MPEKFYFLYCSKLLQVIGFMFRKSPDEIGSICNFFSTSVLFQQDLFEHKSREE